MLTKMKRLCPVLALALAAAAFLASPAEAATTTVTASWGADITSAGAKDGINGDDPLGFVNPTLYRVALKFDLSSLNPNVVVSRVELRVRLSTAGAAAHRTDFHL